MRDRGCVCELGLRGVCICKIEGVCVSKIEGVCVWSGCEGCVGVKRVCGCVWSGSEGCVGWVSQRLGFVGVRCAGVW